MAVKTVVGKLSRGLQVRVLPGVPIVVMAIVDKVQGIVQVVVETGVEVSVKFMVGVAQLVEPRIVIPVVVGSIPIVHPINFY